MCGVMADLVPPSEIAEITTLLAQRAERSFGNRQWWREMLWSLSAPQKRTWQSPPRPTVTSSGWRKQNRPPLCGPVNTFKRTVVATRLTPREIVAVKTLCQKI